jgi:translation elongation factor EF-Ts
LVEINCSSDTVAQSGPVAKLAAVAARLLLRHPDADIAQAANTNLNIDEVSQQTGENVRIGRSAFLRNKNGRVGTYNDLDGRIGVLVSITGKIDEEILKNLCLHVARHDPPPAAVTRDHLPQEVAASPDAANRALMEQKLITDPSKTIGELIAECQCSLVEFVRVEVGA